MLAWLAALVVNESQALRQCLDDTPIHRVQLLPEVSHMVRQRFSRHKKPTRSVDRAVRGPYCRMYYAHDIPPGLPYPAFNWHALSSVERWT